MNNWYANMQKLSINKPQCFNDFQWKIYQQELQTIKSGKLLDICFDCTVEYQSKMRKEGKCAYPMKRLDKVTEYAWVYVRVGCWCIAVCSEHCSCNPTAWNLDWMVLYCICYLAVLSFRAVYTIHLIEYIDRILTWFATSSFSWGWIGYPRCLWIFPPAPKTANLFQEIDC